MIVFKNKIGQKLVESFLTPLEFDNVISETIDIDTSFVSFIKHNWTNYKVLIKTFVDPEKAIEATEEDLAKFIALCDNENTVGFISYIEHDKNYLPKNAVRLVQLS